MTTVTLQPSGQKQPIAVEINGNQISTEDKTFSLLMHWDSPTGGWVHNTQTHEILPFRAYTSGEEVLLWLSGKVYRYNIVSPQARRQRSASASSQISEEIKAPMPGSILKIMVKPGDTVEENTPLLIMESMKMEMTLTSPVKSHIKQIYCEVGQLVEMNTRLIQLKAEANGSEIS